MKKNGCGVFEGVDSPMHTMGPMWTIFVSFVYTGLLVRAFPYLHRLNLTYYSKSFRYLHFTFVFSYGKSNSNMFLIHLTIRTVSGDHVVLRG